MQPDEIPLHEVALDKARASVPGKFYLAYLRRFRLMQMCARRLWRMVLPSYMRFITITYVYDLIPVRTAIVKRKATTTILAPAEKLQTPAPSIFPESARANIIAPHTSYTFPAISITHFTDAKLHGGCNFIFFDDAIVHHDLYNFAQDYTPEEMHGRASISVHRKKIEWFGKAVELPPIARAASLLDGCASNYAHWLTEVLPRAAVLASQTQYDSVPILVDAGLHPNLMESLKLVVGDRPIHCIARHESIKVGELINVSPTGYVPYEWRRNPPRNVMQGMFSPFALALLSSHLVETTKESPVAQNILVRRNSSNRTILNMKEIETLLGANDIIGIEPEKMSITSQVAAFHNARTVVGQGGAAMANLIFCKPGTHIVIFNVDMPRAAHWYWQNMALATGNHVTLALGTPLTTHNSHSDFSVSIPAVEQALRA